VTADTFTLINYTEHELAPVIFWRPTDSFDVHVMCEK